MVVKDDHDQESHVNDTNGKHNDHTNEKNLEETVRDELDRIGQGGIWVWTIFLLCTAPNILNGFHVSSYVFIGKMPDSYWCEVPALMEANWTKSEMLSITSINPMANDACNILNYDYDYLSKMNYSQAVAYTQNIPRPDEITCIKNPQSYLNYNIEGSSIVPEWDLVCDNNVLRTLAQVAVSFGKCIGASTVGILSDKYGRKNLFGYGAIVYTLGSLLVGFSPWYWPFLLGRFFLGSSSSGLFYPALVMMTENVAVKHRYWMGILFNVSYPIGMLYISLAGLFLLYWRDFQLALTIPAFTGFVFWYFFRESPRWLLSKGRTEEAYEIVFNKKLDKDKIDIKKEEEQEQQVASNSNVVDEANLEKPSFAKRLSSRLLGIFHEFATLYGPSKQRYTAFICHFAFFTSAFSYYVTAINADNLSANKVIYVTATGCVDTIGYFSTVLLLRFVSRKYSCCIFFSFSGICMLALLAIPHEMTVLTVVFSMFGRFGISSVYSIITLYTLELFPTEIRNSAVGASSTCGHVGSMSAPFVVDLLGILGWYIPTTICGALLFTAALLVLLNPETSKKKLDDFVKETETTSPPTTNTTTSSDNTRY